MVALARSSSRHTAGAEKLEIVGERLEDVRARVSRSWRCFLYGQREKPEMRRERALRVDPRSSVSLSVKRSAERAHEVCSARRERPVPWPSALARRQAEPVREVELSVARCVYGVTDGLPRRLLQPAAELGISRDRLGDDRAHGDDRGRSTRRPA